jgi:beta-mannosidase
VASWSSVEYGGKWKPLQYLARRFFANVAVQAGPDGGITAVNDFNREVAFDLVAEYWSFDGRLVKAENISVKVPAGSAKRVGSWKKIDGTFLYLRPSVAEDAGYSVYANDWMFFNYKDCNLANASVDIGFDGFEVTLKADKPAFWVWANVSGVPGEFSDNAFTLLPGRPVKLRFVPESGDVTPEMLRRNFSLTHLRKTY